MFVSGLNSNFPFQVKTAMEEGEKFLDFWRTNLKNLPDFDVLDVPLIRHSKFMV